MGESGSIHPAWSIKMSIWHYAYMFPQSNVSLIPENAIPELTVRDLEFDDRFYSLEIFEDGGLEASVENVKLTNPFDRDLYERLSRNEQIQVTCRNKDLFFTCTFASTAFDPSLCFSWSRNFFSELDSTAAEEYRRMLRRIANAVNASYVIIVQEPPNDLYDHFVDIDGVRHLNAFFPDGGKQDLREVWSKDPDSIIPEGCKLIPSGKVEDGFHLFDVLL